MAPIIDSVLRAGEGRLLRKLKRISEQINSIEDDFVAMSDAELRALTDEFRERYADGETLDDLLRQVPGFSLRTPRINVSSPGT